MNINKAKSLDCTPLSENWYNTPGVSTDVLQNGIEASEPQEQSSKGESGSEWGKFLAIVCPLILNEKNTIIIL
jgi:hypothetical protein